METCEICGGPLSAGTCSACVPIPVDRAEIPPVGDQTADDTGLFGGTRGADFFGVITPTLADNSTPLPTVVAKKSRAWMYAVGGFAVVVVGVGVVSASFLGLFVGNGNETAGYVPADAQGYFVIDLVDSASAFSDDRIQSLMARIEQEFGVETPDFDGGVVEEETLDELAQELGVSQLDLSFRDDVASWAGRHIGIWFRADISADAQPEDVAGCFLVETRDAGDADAALERIYGEIRQGDLVIARSEVNGVAVYEWSDELDEVVVKAGRIDGVVALCAGAGIFEEVVAVHESGVTLASTESFTHLEGALADWAMMGYVDGEEMVRGMTLEQGMDVTPFAQAGRLAVGVNLTEAGFTFESASVAGPDIPVMSDGLAAAGILPGNVYFAAGGQDLGRTISTMIDAYRGVPDVGGMIDDAFSEMRETTGVDLQEMLDSMEGPFGLAVSANSSIEDVPVGGVFFTDLSDRDPIDDLLSFAMADAGFEPAERASGEYSVMVYDFDVLKAGVGVSDNRFVLAIEDQLIDQMVAGDVLANDPSFLEAVGYLPEGSGWVAYADLRKIITAVIDVMNSDMTRQVDDLELLSALEIFRDRFPYVVSGVENRDGLVRQHAVMVFTEGSTPGV